MTENSPIWSAAPPEEADVLKACCANAYESPWASLLLGASFHPGGLKLTEHVGQQLNLGPGQRLLDVAAGTGTSAIHLAQTFGCSVVGIDYGRKNVAAARAAAAAAGVADLVTFELGDAEQLPVPAGAFDALLCECAFCTFPDKATAAAEFARVLRPGGRLGLSDLTRQGELPLELTGLLAWVACIAAAQPVDRYIDTLQATGFTITHIEAHNRDLDQLVKDVRTRLLGAELMIKMGKLAIPGLELAHFAAAKPILHAARTAVRQGRLGYAVLIGTN